MTGAVSALPLNPVGTDYDLPVIIEGKPRPKPGQEPTLETRIATPGYFQTIGIPVIKGRLFTAQDDARAPQVALISETAAKRFFPGENPIGRKIRPNGTLPENASPLVAPKRSFALAHQINTSFQAIAVNDD